MGYWFEICWMDSRIVFVYFLIDYILLLKNSLNESVEKVINWYEEKIDIKEVF